MEGVWITGTLRMTFTDGLSSPTASPKDMILESALIKAAADGGGDGNTTPTARGATATTTTTTRTGSAASIYWGGGEGRKLTDKAWAARVPVKDTIGKQKKTHNKVRGPSSSLILKSPSSQNQSL